VGAIKGMQGDWMGENKTCLFFADSVLNRLWAIDTIDNSTVPTMPESYPELDHAWGIHLDWGSRDGTRLRWTTFKRNVFYSMKFNYDGTLQPETGKIVASNDTYPGFQTMGFDQAGHDTYFFAGGASNTIWRLRNSTMDALAGCANCTEILGPTAVKLSPFDNDKPCMFIATNGGLKDRVFVEGARLLHLCWDNEIYS
jgi:hypothetical protein